MKACYHLIRQKIEKKPWNCKPSCDYNQFMMNRCNKCNEKNCFVHKCNDADKIILDVDNYMYCIGNYKSLGQLKKDKNLEVEYHCLPPETKITKVTIPSKELKRYLKHLEDFNIEGMNELIIKEIEDIKQILEDNKGKKDIEWPLSPMQITGEYIREKPKDNPKIILYLGVITSKEELICTYVHEMMHAYYDRDNNQQPCYYKYIEEPLTEFAMLNFMKEYRDGNGKNYYNEACKIVEEKKYCRSCCYYGFGHYLHEHRNDVPWQKMMFDKKYFDCSKAEYYKSYIELFQYGFYPFKEEHKYSYYLYSILKP